MKKLIYLLCFVLLMAGCKKSNDGLEVEPDPEFSGVNIASDFLKTLTVTGAKEATFDAESNSYLVSLPDNFNQQKAEVKLVMQPAVFLVDSLDKTSANSNILYAYQGTAPLRFQLRDKSGKHSFYFTVYFNFSGTPEIELLQNEIPISASGIQLPLRFKTKVGSNPAAPGQVGTLVRVTNKKTGYTMATNLDEGSFMIHAESPQNLITDDPLTLEVNLHNQNPVVFEGVKFTRSVPSLYPASSQFQYAYKDTVQSSGGYFSPTGKYTVVFSSDFLETPVTAPVRFNNISLLSVDKIPPALPEGSYLLSYYENDKLMGKSSIQVSKTETNCIETIWTGDVNGTLGRNVQPLSFSKGDFFYAKQSPVEFGSSNTKFDVAKLPAMRLKSAVSTVDLAPELVVFHWAIAGVSYSFGKYTIPNNLQAGKYGVSAVFANKQESKPYWSRLEVR